MDIFSTIGLLLGSSWSSGINLYLSMTCLGVAHRMEWLELPGNMDILSHPAMIGVAGVMFLIEFVADKVPYVDSAWDSVHTFIRPIASSLLGYSAMADSGMIIQVLTAFMSGSIALESHLTKATARAVINTSPEPITNSVASVTEDVAVVGVMYLIINHPVIAGIVIVVLIAASVFFLIKMFKYLKKVFKFFGKKKGNDTTIPATGGAT